MNDTNAKTPDEQPVTAADGMYGGLLTQQQQDSITMYRWHVREKIKKWSPRVQSGVDIIDAIDRRVLSQPEPVATAANIRRAWEAGFELCRSYGDNWKHFEGEQKEHHWQKLIWTMTPAISQPEPTMPKDNEVVWPANAVAGWVKLKDGSRMSFGPQQPEPTPVPSEWGRLREDMSEFAENLEVDLYADSAKRTHKFVEQLDSCLAAQQQRGREVLMAFNKLHELWISNEIDESDWETFHDDARLAFGLDAGTQRPVAEETEAAPLDPLPYEADHAKCSKCDEDIGPQGHCMCNKIRRGYANDARRWTHHGGICRNRLTLEPYDLESFRHLPISPKCGKAEIGESHDR